MGRKIRKVRREGGKKRERRREELRQGREE